MAQIKSDHFSGMKNIFTRGANGLATILNAKVDRSKVATLNQVTVANASDLATAIALANDLKTKLNALQTALKDAT